MSEPLAPQDRHRLYGQLAPWWPLVSKPADYAEEAGYYWKLLETYSSRPPCSLLEIGSGGGNNASHLKRQFESVTLVDRSPGMLSVSRRLNPECEHVEGDMFDLRLGRTFDCTFLHDAVCYAITLDHLGAAIETLFVHTRPGGVALIAPDFVRETFRSGTSSGGHDGTGQALRYLEWTHEADPGGCTYVVDFAFVLRDGDDVSVHHDRHVAGLFGRQEWLDVLTSVGFHPTVETHRFSDVDWEMTSFIGTRPEES